MIEHRQQHLLHQLLDREAYAVFRARRDVVLQAVAVDLRACADEVVLPVLDEQLEHLQPADEPPRQLLLRIVEYLLGWAVLVDAALIHVEHPVADRPGEGHLVRHDHHRLSALGEVADDRLHLPHHRGIEGARRLVKQNHVRVHGQRAGDGDTLLLPAGELIGILQLTAGKPHPSQERHAGVIRLLLRFFEDVHRREHQIFDDRQVPEQVERLEHHPHPPTGQRQIVFRSGNVDAVEQNLPFRRTIQHVDTADQRRFSGAGRADDRDHVAVVYDRVHVRERRGVFVFLFEMYKLDHLVSAPFRMSSRERLRGSMRISILFTKNVRIAARMK